MSKSIFDVVGQAPDDPILGLVELYKNDPRDTKVNLGVGIYLDNEGRLPLMKAVGAAEQRLAQRALRTATSRMSGLPAYCAAIQKLVFGATNEAVLSGRIATIQSLGGTGALRLGAVFAHEYLGLTKAVVSNPTWGNHITLFEHAGLKVDRYPYLNKEKNGVDFEAMKACLEGLEAGTVVLLHACCHNPTGYDLNASSGPRSRGSFRNATCFPSSTSPIRASAPALTTTQPPSAPCAPPALSFMVSSSCSKNFGLYGERAGGLHVVTPNADEAAVVTSIIKAIVRAEYSNPATHGAAIVNEVLNDEELYAVWEDEVTGMRTRIRSMRESLVAAGEAVGADLSFAVRQAGMFSFTGLNAEQMLALREKYGVYGVANRPHLHSPASTLKM